VCALLHNAHWVRSPTKSNIISARRGSGNGGHNAHCWNTPDPYGRNSAQPFAPYCSASMCSCRAWSALSVGIEPHAMCHSHPPAPPPTDDTVIDEASLASSRKPTRNPVWNEWMGQLACLMSGNWYSTQSVSQCRSGIDSDCWWRLKSPLRGDREINASCADERVQQALRRRRPECWAQCGAQANNVTALCPVMCLFSTMLGNRTANIPPMEKNDVVQPFVDAFKPVAEGGCPDARPAAHAVSS
jgi:hypothetical protein